MKTLLFIILLYCTIYLNGQNINNTLGNGETYSIKDASTTFLSLSQATGFLTINSCINLVNTSSSSLGIIFKGSDRFIHNYQVSGTDGRNTFIGINSGNFSLSGGNNYRASNITTTGYLTLSALTTGFENSAFGSNCLPILTTGYNNSVFGTNSANVNNSYVNSIFGYYAGYNSTGRYITVFGSWGKYTSETSISCFINSFGYQTHYLCTGGSNCAFGTHVLMSSGPSSGNCGFGKDALSASSDIGSHSAFGCSALEQMDDEAYCQALGYRALRSNKQSNCSGLGYNAGSSYGSGLSGGYVTIIGANAAASSVTATYEITLGDGTITKLRCNRTSITALSDARDKRNIRDLNLGLNFIMTLKPRLYNWDRREWYNDGKSDGSKMQQTPTAGFIAQELDEAQKNANAEWLNLVLKSNPDRLEATPGNLLPVIVKSLQELKIKEDLLKEDINSFKSAFPEMVSKEIKSVLTKLLLDNNVSYLQN